MRCVSISWVDTTGHCKVEIPVAHLLHHCCVIDLADVGDRVFLAVVVSVEAEPL